MSVPLSSPLNSNQNFIDPDDLQIDTSIESSLSHNHTSNMYGSRITSQENEAMGLSGYFPVSSSKDENHQPLNGTDGSQSSQSHGMYGSFVAYAFTVNYILGVGVLGMPYAFYRGGYILSSLCLGLVTVMASYTALWLVDVSLRAQYLKRMNHLLHHAPSSSPSASPTSPIVSDAPSVTGVLEISQPVSTMHHHRFEMNELTEMFLGLKARRFYELLVIIYLVGALWSYSSVFSSSLASHIGIPGLNGGHECDIYKDHSSGCSDLYYAYMGMFALVAIPLTCLDLTEMMSLQIGLALFRFVALFAMMITSLAALYNYPNPDPEARSPASAPYVSGGIEAFNWGNLGLVFPVAVYSQIFHHSVPGLTHPLKNKKKAPKVFSLVLITTMCLYTMLGVIVPLWYGGSIPQTCTIAWANYTGGHDQPGESKPGWANFLGYLIVLFPPIDIISAFPLNAITLGNNLLCAFVEDERKQQLRRFKIPFRLLAACPPIVGGMLVKDLSTILQYTGCVGVLIAFVYPVFLQWKSKQACQKFGIMVEADVDSLHEDDDDDAHIQAKITVPTYNGSIINHRAAIWVVLAFSSVGLVAVIVLSIIDG